eukprot:1486816-Rhodomonas_salina.1
MSAPSPSIAPENSSVASISGSLHPYREADRRRESCDASQREARPPFAQVGAAWGGQRARSVPDIAYGVRRAIAGLVPGAGGEAEALPTLCQYWTSRSRRARRPIAHVALRAQRGEALPAISPGSTIRYLSTGHWIAKA